MNWKDEYQSKLRTADEAVRIVKNNDIVHIGTASSVAYILADALYRRRDELENVTISSGTNMRVLPFYTDADSPFKILTYFAGPGERAAMKAGKCSYTSLHLSQIDRWCEGMLSGGVAFIEVSKPDRFGYMSYGAYGVAMHDDVVRSAGRVVLQVNKNVPYVYGVRHTIHVSQADYIVEADDTLAQVPDMPVDDVTRTISEYIVDQIPDGATIQLGLGGLSGAVGFGLQNKNDLGVHSEMYTNSMMHLAKMGVINNRRKSFMPGKSLAGFALGSQELYEYIDRNPEICFAPYTYVNNPYVIGKKMI